ncbi:MAG: polymorphic toxin type 17 domain-containing protein [Chloroflexota bacterium]
MSVKLSKRTYLSPLVRGILPAAIILLCLTAGSAAGVSDAVINSVGKTLTSKKHSKTSTKASEFLGTPVLAFDSDGNQVWERELDIYGNPRIGDNIFCPFTWQGQYYDEETGLAYNRFRYYNPETGTYISQDPIGLEGNNPNLYAYVSDSNTQIDPFGLECTKAAKAVTSSKSLIKGAQLPNTGKIRFVPRAADVKNGKLLKQNGGYVDKFGNVWKKGPSRTEGQAFEWDVQLSKTGKNQLGHLSPDGKHLNISLDGKVTH